MTAFTGVANMSRWISQTGLAPAISGILEYLHEDFMRWQEFEKLPRIASHTPFGVIELMPASDADTYSFKYVNGHPFNPASGFQTVTAFGVLADVRTGYPIFVSEMTLLTALRTAATSALAAKYLARPDARTAAFIGAGSQAEFQTIALCGVRDIERVKVWDIDPAAMQKYQRNLRSLDVEIVLASSADDAVTDADIITTCTADKAIATVLLERHVKPGVHINAIGGDCPGKTELEGSILERGPVFVEYTPQTRIEGEIQQMAANFAVTELWEVLQGQHPGRRNRDQVTIFDSVGFAVEDFSALRFVRDRVSGTEFCTDIDLVAEPSDPKDLFGMIDTLAPVE